MNLSFSARFPFGEKKPTLFKEKINSAIIQWGLLEETILDPTQMLAIETKYNCSQYAKTYTPKLHTIRVDKGGKWQKDIMIDFWMFSRTKNQERIAPRLPLISKQTVRINPKDLSVYVDNTKLLNEEIFMLAINDGFDNVTDFWNWFSNDSGHVFEGFILHWTNHSYGGLEEVYKSEARNRSELIAKYNKK